MKPLEKWSERGDLNSRHWRSPSRAFLCYLRVGVFGDLALAHRQEDGVRFIASIERLEEGGWRASFRLRVPSDVFTQEGETEVFATELQATKWLHTQAAARGFSSIEIKR